MPPALPQDPATLDEMRRRRAKSLHSLLTVWAFIGLMFAVTTIQGIPYTLPIVLEDSNINFRWSESLPTVVLVASAAQWVLIAVAVPLSWWLRMNDRRGPVWVLVVAGLVSLAITLGAAAFGTFLTSDGQLPTPAPTGTTEAHSSATWPTDAAGLAHLGGVYV